MTCFGQPGIRILAKAYQYMPPLHKFSYPLWWLCHGGGDNGNDVMVVSMLALAL